MLYEVITNEKDAALRSVMKAIDADRKAILAANAKDVEKARAGGMKESLVDRLALNEKRIDGMIEGVITSYSIHYTKLYDDCDDDQLAHHVLVREVCVVGQQLELKFEVPREAFVSLQCADEQLCCGAVFVGKADDRKTSYNFV